jgi:CheY-like chemotaxis protein
MPGQTILIIDDDSTFRTNLSGVRKAAGYKSIEAHDGRTALTAIDQVGTSIDLMIVDLCLPDDVNGLDIILTATRRKLPVKIIAASAVFDQLHLDIAKDLGADAALRKPLDGEVATLWLELVRRLLGKSDSHPVPSQRLVVVVDDEGAVRGVVKAVLRRAEISSSRSRRWRSRARLDREDQWDFGCARYRLHYAEAGRAGPCAGYESEVPESSRCLHHRLCL